MKAIETNVETFALTAQILDEKEPVLLTPELIREKSAPLMELTIAGVFDETGYKAVKTAKNKAVKTRTTIEKLEKEVLDGYKKQYEAHKKDVTDYTAGLYAACRDVEKALGDRLAAVDNAKAEAKAREEAELRRRTIDREQRLYSIGMNFNGISFVGYAKVIARDGVHAMADEAFESLCDELSALAIEYGVTGKESPAEPAVAPQAGQPAPVVHFDPRHVIYHRKVNNAIIYITKGQQQCSHDAPWILQNDNINGSNYYVQAVAI